MKSQAEIEKLKKLWLDDPDAFKLEDVEGFEAHRKELRQFTEEHLRKKQDPFGMPAGLIPMLINSAMGMIGSLGKQEADQKIMEDTASMILRRLLKDAPDELTGKLEEDYYRQLGQDAYRRAHYILMGRNQYAKAKCPCNNCTEARREQEE